jgi:hypothetical protein
VVRGGGVLGLVCEFLVGGEERSDLFGWEGVGHDEGSPEAFEFVRCQYHWAIIRSNSVGTRQRCRD